MADAVGVAAQVLERLNSVLDPGRTLVLPERSSEIEEVRAAAGFRLMATMNPGGDFGKKELSPALRNRFTEVWVPAVEAREELADLIARQLGEVPRGRDVADAMLDFVEWLGAGGGFARNARPSLRDLVACATFVSATWTDLGPAAALVHGAALVFVDCLGLQVSSSRAERASARARCIARLRDLVAGLGDASANSSANSANLHVGADTVPEFSADDAPSAELMADGSRRFGLAPFYVPMGAATSANSSATFSLKAPTTRSNAFKVLRAMQLRKPILLEGSPGVGKTSLVSALGAACARTVVRINLSEQTDLMDLLGSDLPVEGAPPGTYAWVDGAFLAALRAGHWVILDELNLAPQSVLEGLNACLDYRASVYIPELGTSFACPPTFRVFGCQNPMQQGGGRKGLPKSFLNRFTQAPQHQPPSDNKATTP